MTDVTHTPPPTALSPDAERWIVRSLTLVLAVIALSSAALSAIGLHTVGVDAGFQPALAWLLPVCIDGLVLAGTLSGLHGILSRTGSGYGWVLVLVGTFASVIGNVATAEGGMFAKGVHAVPPLAYALSVEAVAGPIRLHAKAAANKITTKRSPGKPPAKASTAPELRTATTIRHTSAARPATDQPLGISVASATSIGKVSGIEQARILFREDITRSVDDVAQRVDVDRSAVRKALREVKAEREPTAA